MKQLLNTLKTSHATDCLHATGLRASSIALCAARQHRQTKRPVIVITPSEDALSSMERDLHLFTDAPVFTFPAYDIAPYTPLSPDGATISTRLATLFQMGNLHSYIVVVSVETLLRRIPPLAQLDLLAELLEVGEEVDRDNLISKLIGSGYEQVSLVQNSGEFTVRGGIIDIFPPAVPLDDGTLIEGPLRLDFFGETLESLRYFDPISQRSIKEITETILLPVADILYPGDANEHDKIVSSLATIGADLQWNETEQRKLQEFITERIRFPGIESFGSLFYPEMETFLHAINKDSLIISSDTLSQNQTIQLTWERIKANYSQAQQTATPALPPEQLFLSEEELQTQLGKNRQLLCHDFCAPDSQPIRIKCGNHVLFKQELDLHRKKEGLFGPLTRHLQALFDQGARVCISCRSEKNLRQLYELLTQHGMQADIHESPLEFKQLQHQSIGLTIGSLSSGFSLEDEQVHLFSESELFGEKRIGRKQTQKHPNAGDSVSFEQLEIGELVVHTTHGIGIYQGIVNMKLGAISNDFLQINFKDNDKLYVPIDRLNTVSKYKGLSDKKPTVDALGGKSWAKTKSKVQEAVWKVAQYLLKLYAKRKIAVGHQFTPPGELFHELEESFPYDETAGQMNAINDCLDDLTSERTMDRLVCGDVGYGKTEVAIRAAFKVVEDGFQVAILVPTTVLAEQHADSFRERFAGFPVRVESLNRFRTPKEQRDIITDTSKGKVDILIGTHRLLSKDVTFAKLGFLIIDEEHRFGVSHKEKLKKLKQNIDVLTLTATPIPRTLQMSLLGVRDLSVINTPPRHRRTIKTFVAKEDDLVMKEAITKELQRGGQVFIVHNRVRTINEVASRIQKLVPEARIGVGHGQMAVKMLEEKMVAFVNHKVDILVCTTIIESGLDIPNANTIIITRADRLGLAGIYQLRGRVGRSAKQAYAYLLVPTLDGLSKDAKQRLRALMDYNELGGGFKLAMSDLQIRGGGNILGESQSGNIAAVGYDLYLDLLQRTVEDLKRHGEDGRAALPLDYDPEINLQLSAYIPASYIFSPDQRYIAYRRISAITELAGVEEQREELRDRYGNIPDEVENLLQIIELKIMMRPFHISRLDQGPGSLAFNFMDDTEVTPEQILILVKGSKGTIRITPDNRVIVTTSTKDANAIFKGARNVLLQL
jgi:transcription-repair coupling factor (superfamily II helicase)